MVSTGRTRQCQDQKVVVGVSSNADSWTKRSTVRRLRNVREDYRNLGPWVCPYNIFLDPIRKPQDRRHRRASVRPSALQRESRPCASQVTVIDLTIDSDWEDEDELLEVEAILSDPIAVVSSQWNTTLTMFILKFYFQNTSLRVPRKSPAPYPKQALQSTTRSSMAAYCSPTHRGKSDFTDPIPLVCTLNPTISGQPLMLGSAKDPIVIDWTSSNGSWQDEDLPREEVRITICTCGRLKGPD